MKFSFKFLLIVIFIYSNVAILGQVLPNGTLKGAVDDTENPSPRTIQYFPDGRDIVCVNGKNKYTRALYGSPTAYRIETSDRPIFAIFKKNENRNVRFVVTCNGESFQIDSAEWCEARYFAGSRVYKVKDKRWGEEAVLHVKVVASADTEEAVWQISTEKFAQNITLHAIVCNIKGKKIIREGDLGVCPRDVFEPLENDSLMSIKSLAMGQNDTTWFAVDGAKISEKSLTELQELFNKSEDYFEQLANRIIFNTPDPHINTLGGALVVAADGNWDGQTWLHGCIGWRTTLPGWRAGFLGDILGWNDRALSHFNAYAKSQVNNVEPIYEHPTQDAGKNLSRAEKRWGTQMYSNGYICRTPGRNDQMHHYDMNLNYIDELLLHFCFDADTSYMRKMWPVITSHLAWEKRNYDPDGDGLYDAYCCIWASDALYYNGGGVTHSTAYNYRGNLMTARIAEKIGEDPTPYLSEAEHILGAMNEKLWIKEQKHWAEYIDLMGLKRRHNSAALWSIYTPIDCNAGTSGQFWWATRYIDREIPHINVEADGKNYGQIVSTTNWMPYDWSINNVASAEVMHTALAYFQAGRPGAGYALMKANIMDNMFLGCSPGNFGQTSYYDAACGETYRDFGDVLGIASRAFVQGLFGITPDAIDDKCIIRPGFPSEWDSASISTPYLSYSFRREGEKEIYDITQSFSRPLKIIIRQNRDHGGYFDVEGNSEHHQVITVDRYISNVRRIPEIIPMETLSPEALGLGEPSEGEYKPVNIDNYFNANVSDIFNNKYLSPRPQVTTLQIPIQGIGQWCVPDVHPEINDSVFRSLAYNNEFTLAGVPFRTPQKGRNIVYTTLWDNYPDSITIPLNGKASSIYLLMAGSTNPMQSRIDNGLVVVTYKDSTSDTLFLRNPDNWCPIEQDYYVDNKAFYTTSPRPYRVCFGTAEVSRDLGKSISSKRARGRDIPSGAGQMLKMCVDSKKELSTLTLQTLSCDVVMGLMSITLQ